MTTPIGNKSKSRILIVVSKCEKASASLMEGVRTEPENANQTTTHHAGPMQAKGNFWMIRNVGNKNAMNARKSADCNLPPLPPLYSRLDTRCS